jgi:hypothetical protein
MCVRKGTLKEGIEVVHVALLATVLHNVTE